MNSKVTTNYHTPDHKDSGGLWVRSYRPEINVVNTTRAGTLWNAVNYRTKKGNKIAQKTLSYASCTNDFGDFQLFADWCQGEFGYMRRDNRGYMWALDKDILNYGNKSYNSENCMFIPCGVNSLFTSKNLDRDFPQGVCYQTERNGIQRIKAQCKDINGKNKYLGLFEDPMEGHRAWQQHKIIVLNKYKAFPEIQGHYKFMLGVDRYIERIDDDYKNFRETKHW